jgi:hypothetical protein
MLGHSHPVRRSAHDGGDLVDTEIGQNSQQDHVGLIRWQRGYHKLGGLLCGQLAHDFVFGIVHRHDPFEALVADGVSVATKTAATMIGNSAASDREHPRPEPGGVSCEPAQPGRHRHPHLASQVVGRRWLARPKEPQQPRMNLAEQHRHRGVVTATRGN